MWRRSSGGREASVSGRGSVLVDGSGGSARVDIVIRLWRREGHWIGWAG